MTKWSSRVPRSLSVRGLDRLSQIGRSYVMDVLVLKTQNPNHGSTDPSGARFQISYGLRRKREGCSCFRLKGFYEEKKKKKKEGLVHP